MKLVFVFLGITFLSACTVLPPLPDKVTDRNISLFLNYEAMDESFIIYNGGLEAYREQYVPMENHKAFAQGGNGATGWAGGYTNVGIAIKKAISGCKEYNKRFRNSEPCRVINVDGIWAVDY